MTILWALLMKTTIMQSPTTSHSNNKQQTKEATTGSDIHGVPVMTGALSFHRHNSDYVSYFYAKILTTALQISESREGDSWTTKFGEGCRRCSINTKLRPLMSRVSVKGRTEPATALDLITWNLSCTASTLYRWVLSQTVKREIPVNFHASWFLRSIQFYKFSKILLLLQKLQSNNGPSLHHVDTFTSRQSKHTGGQLYVTFV